MATLGSEASRRPVAVSRRPDQAATSPATAWGAGAARKSMWTGHWYGGVRRGFGFCAGACCSGISRSGGTLVWKESV